MSSNIDQKDKEVTIQEAKSLKALKKFSVRESLFNQSNNQRKIYINQTEKNNKKFRYPDNFIKTSKYTLITFLPLSILTQFKRYANIYFLAMGILQMISIISPYSPTTALFPFFLVLSISLIRDGLEDYQRHKCDERENQEKVLKYDDSTCSFIQVLSKDLRVGEIIKIEEYGLIPADIVLLSCSNINKISYIETANLDGEKNLKPKFCLVDLFNHFKDGDKVIRARGKIKSEQPNSDLYNFSGKITLNNSCDEFLNIRQFLYKGTILKNTKWAIGIIVYTGSDTKIILNSQKRSSKSSNLENTVNILIGFIFLVQVFISILIALLNYFWLRDNMRKHTYLKFEYSDYVIAILSFFSYILLINTLIPISLIVSLETIKYAQGIFINSDVEMYSKVRNKFVNANTTTLNEELGQIKYIFSDKTGTLTANKLEFNSCAIGDFLYGNTDEFLKDSKLLISNTQRRVSHSLGGRGMIMQFAFPIEEINGLTLENHEGQIYKDKILIPCSNPDFSLQLSNQREIVEQFFLNLSVNHACFSQFDPSITFEKINDFGNIIYKGDSPDDIILVDAARHFGYVYFNGNEKSTNIKKLARTHEGEKIININIEVLKSLEYSSARGMMSTVIKFNNKIICYSKGGDKKINELLDPNYQPFLEKVKFRSTMLGEKGLRIMWIAMKVIDPQYYEKWIENYESQLNSINGESNINKFKFEEYSKLERGLVLIGSTAVEDKLQENVPESIKDFHSAGINFWVLTGDNLPTAKNIGFMCNLLEKDMDIYEICDDLQKFQEIIMNLSENGEIFNENAVENTRVEIQNFEESANAHTTIKHSKSITNKKSILFLGLKEIYNLIKQADSIKRRRKAVLVESQILRFILPPEESEDVSLYDHPLTQLFLDITLDAEAVICCRVSPKQKALVVRLIKKNITNSITLAIGDGANDVSMINEANVGIGIFGEEGSQAAISADYALGEFQCLRRLILHHGRLNYLRISDMILYFFFKNFVFTLPGFYFAFYNIYSGQSAFEDVYVTLYNTIFTAVPLLLKALLEQDISYYLLKTEKMMKVFKENLPFTYYKGRDSMVFNLLKFAFEVLIGIFYSVVVYFFISYSITNTNVLTNEGHVADLWTISLIQITVVVFVVNTRLYVQQKFHTIYNFLALLLTSYLIYVAYFVLSSYVSFSKTQGTFQYLIIFPNFYLAIFLASGSAYILETSILFISYNFSNDPVNLLSKIFQIADQDNEIDISNYLKQINEFNSKQCLEYPIQRRSITPK